MKRHYAIQHPPHGADPVGRLLLGQAELAEQAMRALELKGDLPQRVDAHFQLGLNSLDLTSPEYQYLRRQNRYSGGATVTAVAAQFGMLLFGRPSTGVRDTLAVCEKVLIANTDAAARSYWVYLLQNAASPAPGSGVQMSSDDRVNGGNTQGVGAFRVGFFQTATDFHPSGSQVVAVPAGSTFVLEVPWVLTNAVANGGGALLCVQCTTVNIAFSGGFTWRERALGAPEL